MGFDIDDFVSEVWDDYKCPICLDVLEYPQMLEKCRHIFCKLCIDQILDVKSYCPLDRQQFVKESIQKPIASFMSGYLELQIKCKFYPDCEEQINIENYYSHCEACFFNPKKNLTCCKCKFQSAWLSHLLLIDFVLLPFLFR